MDIFCKPRDDHAGWAAGVVEFEDIAAVQRYEGMMREANVSLYWTSEIMLGTKPEES